MDGDSNECVFGRFGIWSGAGDEMQQLEIIESPGEKDWECGNKDIQDWN